MFSTIFKLSLDQYDSPYFTWTGMLRQMTKTVKRVGTPTMKEFMTRALKEDLPNGVEEGMQ